VNRDPVTGVTNTVKELNPPAKKPELHDHLTVEMQRSRIKAKGTQDGKESLQCE